MLLPALFLLSALIPLQVGSPRIQTAGPRWLVVEFETDENDPPPSIDPADWRFGSGAGTPALQVGRWTYVRHVETAALNHHVDRVHHHIFLESPLGQWVQGKSYTIQGPSPVGVQAFLFDARRTLCESIHVNQVGYSGRSRSRYAIFGAFLGTLGSQDFFSGTPFFYEVRRESDDTLVLTGTSRFWGDDTRNEGGSGERAVYHMDLSRLDDGRYYLDVPGVGRSHPFGVGPVYSKEIAKTVMRGLYHQRCGTALKPAFTPWARAACHTVVEVTDGEPPGFIPPSAHPVTRSIAGGWHDAGDFDRRGPHIVIPAFLLTLYEAFPDRFPDGVLDIPESGDPFGMPDILDEALWGVLLWQNLQEADGGVRWGVETDAHPAYGVVTAATDTLVYRTYRRDRYVTALAAGLFAQASRLIRPFDPARAGELARDARRAWDYAFPDDAQDGALGRSFDAERRRPISESGRLYAGLQLWLLNGRPIPDPDGYLDAFLAASRTLDARWQYPEQYHVIWYTLNDWQNGFIFEPYFMSYLLQGRKHAPDKEVWDLWKGRLAEKAWQGRALLPHGDPAKRRAYPIGVAKSFQWGTVTSGPGRDAQPMIYMYALDGGQKWIDAISQLADYPLGLNPTGNSYITGLGANPPQNPTHLDSFPYDQPGGIGPVPGITLFGPFRLDPPDIFYSSTVWKKVVPAWDQLPMQWHWSDGWSLIPVNEFSVWETEIPNVILYAFLGSLD